MLVFASLLCGRASAQQRCAWQYAGYVPDLPTDKQAISERGVTTIPVIVHIVWQNGEENISDAQVNSQIEVLNQDYRGANIEVPAVHPLFDDLVVDTELEFCLVAITRTPTSISGIYNQFSGGKRRVCHSDLGGHDAIAPDHHLNIWVSARTDNALGSATAPDTSPADEDGVFIPPQYFGTEGTVSAPYNLGRTTTHEIGHYLGLQHPWGPGLENDNNCQGDDGIEDTPKQLGNYQNTCPSIPASSCGSPDMFMNFMNYTDDACMALFTPGQKDRMQASLIQSRPGLMNGSCTPLSNQEAQDSEEISLFPLPASQQIHIRFTTNDIYEMAIFDRQGRLVHQEARGPETYGILDVSTLPTGFYVIKIRDGQNLYIKKLIIAR